MNDEDDYMDDEIDINDEDSIDAHEFEIKAIGNRSIAWRRIEMLKEDLWLNHELNDFADWNEDALR